MMLFGMEVFSVLVSGLSPSINIFSVSGWYLMTKNVRNYPKRIKNIDVSMKQTIDTEISALKSIAQRYDDISKQDLVMEYLNAIEKTVAKARGDYLKENAS